jgi:hypothetical protein
MATVAHREHGRIAEERLFRGNAAHIQQLGITP